MTFALRNWLSARGASTLLLLFICLLILVRIVYRVIAAGPGSVLDDKLLLAVVGLVALIGITVALVWSVRWVLSRGGGTLSVARTVLDEAVRMRVFVGFILLIMIGLVFVPLTSDAESPVRHQVQQFLTYTLFWVTLWIALMTIFLSCWTLSAEVAERQIYTLATKPIGRGSYLLGKWIGIVALDAILVTVAGVAIYGFTIGYLARQQPHNVMDAIELNERVLVARVEALPRPPVPFGEQAAQRLQQMVAEDPSTIATLGEREAEQMGLASAGPDKIMELGQEVAFAQLVDQAQKAWLSLSPLQTQTYIFDGLGNAADYGRFVQWRYKVSASKTVPDDQLRLTVHFNGNPGVVKMATGVVQEYQIDSALIGEDGTLTVEVRHIDPTRGPSGMALDAVLTFRADEMKMLFQVDSFGPNFTRAMIAIWIKMAFLAMLGLMAATFLSFPVACMLALLVFGGAVMSQYLMEAVGSFGGQSEGAVRFVKGVMGFIAWAIASGLSAWGRYAPGERIVDGLLFSWQMVLGCLLWIGVVWTGIAGLIAFLVFRRRELARVQV